MLLKKKSINGKINLFVGNAYILVYTRFSKFKQIEFKINYLKVFSEFH